MTDLINRLSSAPVISGRERAICEIIEAELSDCCETFRLPSGDLIARKPGRSANAKKIMISTNVDVRGFFVTFTEADNKIRLALSDSEFDFSKHIGEALISSGKIKARLLSEKEAPSRISDVYAEVQKTDVDLITPGDFFVLEATIYEENGRVSGLNSASRAVISAMIDSAKRISPEHDVYFAFNSCGIPGGRGAKSAAYTIRPDAAVSLRTLESKEITPVLLARDGISLSSIELFDEVISCAKGAALELSLSATATGTRDAWSVSTSHTGIPTVSLAFPCLDLGEKSESIAKDTLSKFSEMIAVLGENILS